MIKKGLLPIVFVFCSILTIFGCASSSKYTNGNITVLFTSDVHCVVDGKTMGYSSLAKYRNDLLEASPNVILCDLGDALTGDLVGSVSNGEYVVQIMNEVGYDFSLIGSHDFDYGMTGLTSLINQSKYEYLGCNIDYEGEKDDVNGLVKVKPYKIIPFGKTKVAFIGLSTVKDILKSTPRYFMSTKSNQRIYFFLTGSALYQRVQELVDEVRAKGAKYVVVLSALGTDDDLIPNRSYDVIHNTHGIDVVLDGKSHKLVESDKIFNKESKPVLYCQAGTGFSAFGRLDINVETGVMTTKLVSSIRGNKDFKVMQVVKDIQDTLDREMKKQIGKSEVTMIAKNEAGKKIVRYKEMPIGNFCTDAYRAVSGADIAILNAGGIKADIKEGKVTREDFRKVHPFNNKLCVIETTGQNILNALELSASTLSVDTLQGITGDAGGFLQVSGLSFSIDVGIPSTVKKDKSGYFLSAGAEEDRRVYEVAVLDKELGWVPLEPDKKYKLVATNYLIKDGGDGYNMFKRDHIILDEFTEDHQALSVYVQKYLKGVIPADFYAEPEGRINIF